MTTPTHTNLDDTPTAGRRLLILPVLLICLTTITAALTGCNSNPAELNDDALTELHNLDIALGKAAQYDSIKFRHIDSLRARLLKTPVADTLKRWQTIMSIGEEYRVLCADSAINYFEEARSLSSEAKSDSLFLLSEISYIKALSVASLFFRAEREFNSIDTTHISPAMKIELWKARRQYFSYAMGYVEGYDSIEKEAKREFSHFTELILANTPKNDRFHRFLNAEKLLRNSEYNEARKELETLLNELRPEDNLYGMAAYQLADVHRLMGDEENYVKYLALASMSDIKGSVKETLALQTLAKWLYNKKDFDRAYNYINASYENSTRANAKMRTLAISELLPIIDSAYKTRISQSRDKLMTYLLLSSFLFVLTAILLVMRFRQMKRITLAQQRLARVSKVQESYIGHILGLCASYADKLNSLSKLVVRKISSGQADELVKLVKSGKFGEDQTDEFFRIFDNAFLDMNPDYVDEINGLLREDERFTVKRGAPLPAELRIYAFVRLGVDESVKIAQILGYSAATVYTYRNRMRNKAINRENFDKDVANLGHQNYKNDSK